MDHSLEGDLFAAAEELTGIDVEDLGAHDVDGAGPDARATALRQATLLAGCLWKASIVVIDGVFDDVIVLAVSDDRPACDGVAGLSVIGQLPPRFAHHFDEQFARQFLVAAVDLTSRFTAGWRPPSCVAQELVVRVILNQVEVLARVFDVDLHPHWRGIAEELLLEDRDQAWLYDPALDGFEDEPSFPVPGVAPMGFAHWFVPFNDDRHLPPYAQDAPPVEVP